MAFWDRWFKKEVAVLEKTEPEQHDRELVGKWVQGISDSISSLKEDLHRIPALTVAEFNENLEGRSEQVLRKLNELPERIIEPIREAVSLSKQVILTELIRINSHHELHDSNDSVGVRKEAVKPIHEISRELTGKQKRLLAL